MSAPEPWTLVAEGCVNGIAVGAPLPQGLLKRWACE